MTGRSFLTLGVAVLLLLAVRAGAQTLERVLPPIDVAVSAPSSLAATSSEPFVPAGTPVRISGTTIPLGAKGTQVRVEIRTPTGALATLSAPIMRERHWSVGFSATEAPGKYSVSAFTADGKNSAMAAFTVLAPADLQDVAAAFGSGVGRQAADASAAIGAVQGALPAEEGLLPERPAIDANLGAVAASLQELPSRLESAKEAFAALGAIVEQYPAGAHELEPLTTAVQDAASQLALAAGEMRRTGAAVVAGAGACERLDGAAKALTSAVVWFDLQQRLFRRLAQVAADERVSGRIYDAAVSPDRRTAAEESALVDSLRAVAKTLGDEPDDTPAEGLIGFVRQPQLLLAETSRLLAGPAFDRACGRYSGPVSGTFAVETTVNGNQKSWTSTTQITGRLTLIYEKAAARQPSGVPMSGVIEGSASFRVDEDLLASSGLNRQFVLHRTVILPPGPPAPGSHGPDPSAGLRYTASPTFFRVPVKALLRNNELSVTIGDLASTDFADTVQARVVYVVIAPATPVPYTMTATIPLQKAHFILTRGLRTTAVLPVDTARRGRETIRTAANSFDRRDTVSNGDVTVTWNLDVKACTPRCR